MEILTNENLIRARTALTAISWTFTPLVTEKQVSLVRTFLSEPGSGSRIGRLGGWGWQSDPDSLDATFWLTVGSFL